MNFFQRLFRYITSRYNKVQLLIIILVITFGFLLGDSSIFSRISYDKKIIDLNSNIRHYKKKSQVEKRKLEEIHDDRDRVEKFARENYRMKKSNEDLYIVE